MLSSCMPRQRRTHCISCFNMSTESSSQTIISISTQPSIRSSLKSYKLLIEMCLIILVFMLLMYYKTCTITQQLLEPNINVRLMLLIQLHFSSLLQLMMLIIQVTITFMKLKPDQSLLPFTMTSQFQKTTILPHSFLQQKKTNVTSSNPSQMTSMAR